MKIVIELEKEYEYVFSIADVCFGTAHPFSSFIFFTKLIH